MYQISFRCMYPLGCGTSTQIIRIGLNRRVDKTQELAYRLYISEVPPPPKEGFTGLRIADICSSSLRSMSSRSPADISTSICPTARSSER